MMIDIIINGIEKDFTHYLVSFPFKQLLFNVCLNSNLKTKKKWKNWCGVKKGIRQQCYQRNPSKRKKPPRARWKRKKNSDSLYRKKKIKTKTEKEKKMWPTRRQKNKFSQNEKVTLILNRKEESNRINDNWRVWDLYD